MNLQMRLGELEDAATRLRLGQRCTGCGFPNPRGASVVLQWGDVEPRCPSCGGWVDPKGRAAGRFNGEGVTPIMIFKLGPRETAAKLQDFDSTGR